MKADEETDEEKGLDGSSEQTCPMSAADDLDDDSRRVSEDGGPDR
jgi:hypothetical protein